MSMVNYRSFERGALQQRVDMFGNTCCISRSTSTRKGVRPTCVGVSAVDRFLHAAEMLRSSLHALATNDRELGSIDTVAGFLVPSADTIASSTMRKPSAPRFLGPCCPPRKLGELFSPGEYVLGGKAVHSSASWVVLAGSYSFNGVRTPCPVALCSGLRRQRTRPMGGSTASSQRPSRDWYFEVSGLATLGYCELHCCQHQWNTHVTLMKPTEMSN